MASSGMITVAPSNFKISLYDHQKVAVDKLNAWSKKAPKNPSGLLVLPTGGGKTLTATYWLMQNVLSKGKKVLWIAHRYSLLEQAHKSFEMVSNGSYNYRIVSGIHENIRSIRLDDDILIASKASLSVKKKAFRAWLEKNKNNFCFIIDEAHHAPAPGYRRLINDMRKYGGKFFMLGLTATPFRTAEDEQGAMKEVFPDDILYRISLGELTRRDILSLAIFDRIDTDIDMRQLFADNHEEAIFNRIIKDNKFDLDGSGRDAGAAAALIAQNHQRNQLIVDTYKKKSETYGKTLVFALNQAMAELLYKYFKAAGVKTGCVISSYGSQANEATIKDFKENRLDVLVNVNIVTEGVDVPNVETVFLTRPTKSKILMTQMIGRGLRGKKVGGTEVTHIVDFLDKWHDDLVAWVIPEKLYEEEKKVGDEKSDSEEVGSSPQENVPPPDEENLSELETLRAISSEKLAEFIQLASSVDIQLSETFSFIERIPLGYYGFEYESNDDDGDGETKTCTVMVYDCMKAAFDEMMEFLANRPEKNVIDVEALAEEIDRKFFGEREKLLGHSKENILCILRFYNQSEGDLPQWFEFKKRDEYDVATLARHIISAKLSRREEVAYKEEEWNRADGKWKNFFGEQNYMAFSRAIDEAFERIFYPEHFKQPTNELTDDEKKIAENLPLNKLRDERPAIYQKIRDAVYDGSRIGDEYVDRQSGRRSENRMDFDIEYLTPLGRGGKTLPENLRLAFKEPPAAETVLDWRKISLDEIKIKNPKLYEEICEAVYSEYRFKTGYYFDMRIGRSSKNRSDFEIDYKEPFEDGGKTVPENLCLVYKKSPAPARRFN